jgi:glycosyltransferase involved in cell wall biosynthesis
MMRKGGSLLNPIRILQVVTIMNRGGLETMLMNYYRQIDRSKIQFDFMVHRQEKGHYDDEILRLGGRIYRMPPIRPGHYRAYFKQLDQFFAEHREYRVVHAHLNENSSFVLRSAKHAGVPCRIAHCHVGHLRPDWKLPFRWYARLCMKDYPNQYFACSRQAGRWLFGKTIAESPRLTVLHNAIHVQQFAYSRETRSRIRRELGAGDKIVIGHVGRFTKEKNQSFLIDVFKIVREKNPHTLLVLAGDGDLRTAVEKKAKNLDLLPHIRFLGVRSDIPELLQGMDLFVLPSLFEGLPVALVEAQAAGLRCIVSDAVTADADVTGRVEYLSLKKPAKFWAQKILDSSYEREDTSLALQMHGYDAAVSAKWLSDFYESQFHRSARGIPS